MFKNLFLTPITRNSSLSMRGEDTASVIPEKRLSGLTMQYLLQKISEIEKVPNL